MCDWLVKRTKYANVVLAAYYLDGGKESSRTIIIIYRQIHMYWSGGLICKQPRRLMWNEGIERHIIA